MGRFKPVKFAITIIGITLVLAFIVGTGITDKALGLVIPPPELRVVGGCFRDCLDPDQTGFSTLDCPEGFLAEGGVCVEGTIDAILVTTNPDGSTTETPLEVTQDGKVISTVDTTTPSTQDTIKIGGQEFEVLVPDQSVACWFSVLTNVFDNQNNLLGSQKSGFFKVSPVPQLTLVDVVTGANIDDLGGFQVRPAMKCVSNIESGGLDPESNLFPFLGFPSFDTALVLENSKLVVRVWSESPNKDILVDTFNAEITIPELQITSAESREIGTIRIASDRIFDFLPSGMYDSNQHFVLDGQLILHWKTGDPNIDKINFVVDIKTEIIRNENGQVIRVENPLTTIREISVDKAVGETTETNPDCKEDEVAQGTACIKVITNPCMQGQVLVQNVCVKQGTTNPVIQLPDILQKFSACISTGADGCLFSADFVPFYIVGIGIAVFIGAVAQRKQPDIYGLPKGGF